MESLGAKPPWTPLTTSPTPPCFPFVPIIGRFQRFLLSPQPSKSPTPQTTTPDLRRQVASRPARQHITGHTDGRSLRGAPAHPPLPWCCNATAERPGKQPPSQKCVDVDRRCLSNRTHSPTHSVIRSMNGTQLGADHPLLLLLLTQIPAGSGGTHSLLPPAGRRRCLPGWLLDHTEQPATRLIFRATLSTQQGELTPGRRLMLSECLCQVKDLGRYTCLVVPVTPPPSSSSPNPIFFHSLSLSFLPSPKSPPTSRGSRAWCVPFFRASRVTFAHFAGPRPSAAVSCFMFLGARHAALGC